MIWRSRFGGSALVGFRACGERSGFLHCAAHDETVSCFGRNDGSLRLVEKTGKARGLGFGAVALFVFFAGAAGAFVVAADFFAGAAGGCAVGFSG